MTDPFQSPGDEHPFAPFIRILGRGKTGTRSLDNSEAQRAFAMILRGEAEPLQVGAFLMLLRVKEESGEELAGFVSASREQMEQPPADLGADLDWSSYAGKRNQHPWFVLSQLLLAQAGYRVFVHGSDGHTVGRLYTEQVYRALNLPVADSWAGVDRELDTAGLVYFPLRHFCPALQEIIQLRPLLGLRSPVNTLTRMLNPLRAPYSIQSVFHPAYAQLHLEADRLLGQSNSLVFKGESGEVEIKPQAETRLELLRAGQLSQQLLVRQLPGRAQRVDSPGWAPLLALWRGDTIGTYALEAVLATTTAALLLLESDLDPVSARAQAQMLWDARDKQRLKGASCH
jgi:anthranilate phosphoribosyltransferase